MFDRYDKAKKEHPDIDEWLSASIYEEYGDDADSLLGAITCETSDAPWEDPAVFEKVSLLINSRPVFSDIKQDITVKEIAYAVKVLKQRYPDDLFNDDVCRYIALEAAEEGFAIMPSVLHFSQRFLPVVRLSPEQEAVQEAYLEEVNDYMGLRAVYDLMPGQGDSQ